MIAVMVPPGRGREDVEEASILWLKCVSCRCPWGVVGAPPDVRICPWCGCSEVEVIRTEALQK